MRTRRDGRIVCDGFGLYVRFFSMEPPVTDASLTVSLSAKIPDERVAQLTRDLAHSLSLAGIQARPPEAPPVSGQRGDPFTLGVLVLALVTSGTVRAAIECFKAYLSRERTLIIKIARADRTPVEVTSQNVDTPAVHEALAAIASARSG
jgi:Effector Associated Constant Component 1